jgi:SAM-dependent methyltransferase
VPPLDLRAASRVLEPGDDGVWRTRDGVAHTVSFPETGHEACYEIEDASFWFSHRNACIEAALARARARGPFLDVGAGNGFVSAALARRGLSPVALEPGEMGARNARRRGLETVVCAKLEDARFADGSFESAGAFDVIEHVEDDVGLLREMRRVLVRGGVLAVTCRRTRGCGPRRTCSRDIIGDTRGGRSARR